MTLLEEYCNGCFRGNHLLHTLQRFTCTKQTVTSDPWSKFIPLKVANQRDKRAVELRGSRPRSLNLLHTDHYFGKAPVLPNFLLATLR